MKLRVARKILVHGRPLLPARDAWGARMCAQERKARKVVIRHWARRAYPLGSLVDECDAWCHADNRALNAQGKRLKLRDGS